MRYRITISRRQIGGHLLLLLTLFGIGTFLLACGTAAPQDTPAPLPAQNLSGVPQAEPTLTPAPLLTRKPIRLLLLPLLPSQVLPTCQRQSRHRPPRSWLLRQLRPLPRRQPRHLCPHLRRFRLHCPPLLPPSRRRPPPYLLPFWWRLQQPHPRPRQHHQQPPQRPPQG